MNGKKHLFIYRHSSLPFTSISSCIFNLKRIKARLAYVGANSISCKEKSLYQYGKKKKTPVTAT